MALACIGAATLLYSCKEEDRLTLQDTQDITEEAVTDSYFQDMDDMAGVSLDSQSSTDLNGGRVSSVLTIGDDRFTCATVTLEVTGNPEAPSGLITVDFGVSPGCTDSKGNTRIGKLYYTYTGRRFELDSKVVTTTDNYYINGIKLEGTRTLTNVTGSTELAPKFNVILSGGKATFADLSVATRESNITWQWVRGTTPADDFLLIDQTSTASGVTRGGRTYEVSLTKALKFKRFCGGLPVEGIKKYLIDGDKEIVIDYGDGVCDKEIKVTVNGISRSLTVN